MDAIVARALELAGQLIDPAADRAKTRQTGERSMDKLITFAVPCYNSAALYGPLWRRCSGGDDIEIILVTTAPPKTTTPPPSATAMPSSTPSISSGPSTRRTAATAREQSGYPERPGRLLQGGGLR